MVVRGPRNSIGRLKAELVARDAVIQTLRAELATKTAPATEPPPSR